MKTAWQFAEGDAPEVCGFGVRVRAHREPRGAVVVVADRLGGLGRVVVPGEVVAELLRRALRLAERKEWN